MQILNMRKIILFFPILLFSSNLMHPDDPKSRDHNSLGFGVSGDVAISEGIYYVGQTGSSLNNGSVYIYTPNALNGIDQEIIIAPIDNELGFDFGYSIDVYNDLMIIGAPHRTDLIGRAYLYKRDYKSRWQLIETIVPEKSNWSSDFGSQVAINDHHILISDRNVELEKGAVLSMKLNPNTNEWESGATLSYQNMNEHGLFGHSIALINDRTVIGSRNGNVAIEYQYDQTTDMWLEKHIFSPYHYQNKGRYGFAVDLTSNYAIIGSPGYDEQGLVDIYQLVNNKWEKISSISNPESVNESYFGSSISMDDDYLIIGNYNGEKSRIYQIHNDSVELKQTLWFLNACDLLSPLYSRQVSLSNSSLDGMNSEVLN